MHTERLQRYLHNECTPEEAQVVLTFLATPDGQHQLQSLLTAELSDLQPLLLNSAEQQTAQQLFNRIQANKKTGPKAVWTRHSTGWTGQRLTWLAAATVSLLLLATGSWWFYQRTTTSPWLTLHTPYGQTRRVVLPDQSIVTLNGNTSIRYAKQWQTELPREIWVEGEAFFEVVHTRNHQPFRVHLPERMNVEVLGTRFNVYTRQSATRVVLNEGRIQMRVADNPGNQLEMKPGEMFFADTKTRIFYKKPVDAQAQSSWRTDKLVFDGTTLAEIAGLLEDTYGLEVDIRNQKLNGQKFSGTIPSKDAATILRGLSGLFDLTITRTDNHVTIE